MKIISASRREDMPAFGMHRILDKYAKLGEDTFWVFWTKDPSNLAANIGKLDPKRMALQVTITGFGGHPDVEPGVPDENVVFDAIDRLIDNGVNPKLITWRMDPVLYNYDINMNYIASRMCARNIDKCVISFPALYDFVKDRWPAWKRYSCGDVTQQRAIAAHIYSWLREEYGIVTKHCGQPQLDGIMDPSSCIDAEYISRITGFDLDASKDRSQRKACGCAVSTDIGEYKECQHGCKYCYSRQSSPQQSLKFE